ncbi:MAG: DUF2189 domain-containing protein [Candidatus Competibacteraceae bacterium]|nr:DUF2189 domain-containing protein [Candidatus Competibacteraceae bacterium]
MVTSIPVVESSLTTPRVRIISFDQPWEWLAAGWKDLWRAPAASIPYGLLFVAGLYPGLPGRIELPVRAGPDHRLPLAGPFLAMGLYDISRRLEAGQPATLGRALMAWRRNVLPISLFGILIGILMIVWARLSTLLFALIIAGQRTTLDTSTAQMFFAVAAAVFTISVVSIPMMLDRKIDFITAVLTSITAVKGQSGAHGIVGGVDRDLHRHRVGHLHLGLAITLPLIGHATWHAYKDLVETTTRATASFDPSQATTKTPANAGVFVRDHQTFRASRRNRSR